MNRRKFLQLMGLAGAAAAIPWQFSLRRMKLESARAFAFVQSPTNLRKFVDSLPGLGVAGQNNLGQYLTVMTPDTATFSGSDYYKLVAGQATVQMHRDLLGPTTFWGYAQDGASPDHKYLGGVILATANRPTRITMRNNLPPTHILPVDQTLPMWNGFPDGAQGVNRMSTHLHGNFSPWISDGTPFQDFDPNGGYGPSAGFPPDMGTPSPGSYHYYHPNQQRAKFLWYHDHAMDITRLNAYAGLASGYVLTDVNEFALLTKGVLPAAAHTIYLVLQDKGFQPDGSGSLFYPFQYEHTGTSARVDWAGLPAFDPDTLPVSLVPEAFFDTTVINGCAYPFLDVEARHYRFRILNGAQARFYNLQLYYAGSDDLTDPASGEADFTKPGPTIVQIGTEGGFLPAPVALPSNPSAPGVTQQKLVFDTNPVSPTLGNPLYYNLLLAPAERADLIIDFSNVPVGSKLILFSDAPAPFPAASGDPRNDYFTGDPDYTDATLNPDGLSGGAPSTQPGFGPNTRTLMQIRVGSVTGMPDSSKLDTIQNAALQNGAKNANRTIFPPILPLSTRGVTIRRLTLNESFEDPTTPAYNINFGRLTQYLGTDVVQGVDQWGAPIFYQSYESGRGEVVKAGTTEIWEIINLTGDTHPIHFHLVNVQVVSRQVFDDAGYLTAGTLASPGTAINPTPFLIGPARPPDANERGWKETVRMNPHEITRVIMRFDLPKVPFEVPLSTRLSDPMNNVESPTNPRINGFEYVWHCHILEHEEHDMMHALTVEP